MNEQQYELLKECIKRLPNIDELLDINKPMRNLGITSSLEILWGIDILERIITDIENGMPDLIEGALRIIELISIGFYDCQLLSDDRFGALLKLLDRLDSQIGLYEDINAAL